MTLVVQALVPGTAVHAAGDAQRGTASAALRPAGSVDAGMPQSTPPAADSFGALLAGVLKSDDAPREAAPERHAASGEQAGEDVTEDGRNGSGRSGEHAGAANAAGAVDVTRGSSSARAVRRDMEGLEPEFRTRLERVIRRMEQAGHTVKINETVRSQERQEWLYAQGRSRPGPVVTWTLNSNHASGRAADLVIDGTYNNPQGYARLAAIAAEEGLRTLGPKDAGHVEMPRAGAGPHGHAHSHGHAHGAADAPQQARAGANAGAPMGAASGTAVGNVAAVATVAAVARPAEVAQVARVAAVARPGGPAPAAPPVSAPVAMAPAAAGIAVQAEAGSSHQDASRRGASPQAVEATSATDPGDGQPRAGYGEARGHSTAAAPAHGAGAVRQVDVAARVAKIMEMQEASAPRRVSSVLLRMDGDGVENRVRLDMRGNALDARIELGDAAAARRADAHLHELRAALQRGGVDPQTIRIQSTAPDAAELLRAALLAEEAGRAQPARSADQQPQRRPGDGQGGQQGESSSDPQDRGGRNQQRKGSQ